jgi:hypothetical protein
MTLNTLLRRFRHVVFCDFEYGLDANGREIPKCVVYYVLPERRMYRVWLAGGCAPARSPFPAGADTLFVAFAAKAEIRCIEVLGWDVPQRIIDAHALARRATNGWRRQPVGPDGKPHFGLLAYLRLFGLDSIDASEKDENRALALRDGPYTEVERTQLLRYCETDVVALIRLFTKLVRRLDLKADLFLGRYSVASARLAGLPIDVPMLRTLESYKKLIVARLIAAVNGPDGPWVPAGPKPPAAVRRFAEERGVCPYALRDAARHLYGLDRAEALAMTDTLSRPIRDGGRVFDERRLKRSVGLIGERVVASEDYTFSLDCLAQVLERQGIRDWPRTVTGRLSIEDDVFKEMAKLHGGLIEGIRQVRKMQAQLRLGPLPVSPDGRCRFGTGDLRSLTGRNQPKARECPLLRSRYERGVIQAPPGFALIECDFVGQEYGIAAYLSGDGAMQRAYESGDPYIYTARLADDVPLGATKETHPRKRDAYKVVSLGIFFGLTPAGAARRLGIPLAAAEALFATHQRIFPRFWAWSEGYLFRAQATKSIRTPLGWELFVHRGTKPRTVLNFPMQAIGAEMLRIVICLLTEQRLRVCAGLHDAVIVEAPSRLVDSIAEAVQAAMVKASTLLLHGHALKVETKIYHQPDRLLDEKGLTMWTEITRLIAEIRSEEAPLPA